MRQDLRKSVVGKRLSGAVWVLDAHHFAVRFALKSCRLVQRVGHGNQMGPIVVGVEGVFARAILKLLHLRQLVPPEVFGFVCGVDDGVRQTIVAVEVLRLGAECIDFSDQVAFIVVPCFPDTAVGERGFGHQRRTEVVFVADLAAQRIGLFYQAGEVVVFERQLIAIGQRDAGQVAGFAS